MIYSLLFCGAIALAVYIYLCASDKKYKSGRFPSIKDVSVEEWE